MEKDAAASGLCAGTAFTQLWYRQNMSNKRGCLSVWAVSVCVGPWGPGEHYELDYFLGWDQLHIHVP